LETQLAPLVSSRRVVQARATPLAKPFGPVSETQASARRVEQARATLSARPLEPQMVPLALARRAGQAWATLSAKPLGPVSETRGSVPAPPVWVIPLAPVLVMVEVSVLACVSRPAWVLSLVPVLVMV